MMTGLAVFATAANAGQLEKLLMPGELSRAHVKEEATCDKCHDNSDKSRQRQLCLDCHKDVAADVAAKAGFHGRAAAQAQCNACHSEHKGRDGGHRRIHARGLRPCAYGFPAGRRARCGGLRGLSQDREEIPRGAAPVRRLPPQ